MTELFQESGNDLTLLEEIEPKSNFFSHNAILQSKDNFFYKLYTSKNSTSTMVYSSSRPSEYLRIKYKLQITRYILMHIFS